MTKITINLETQFLIPTLQVYRDYFDNKYPCTDESNDGTDMSLEDEIKYATYNYLLNVYEKDKGVYIDSYSGIKKKLSDSIIENITTPKQSIQDLTQNQPKSNYVIKNKR